MSESPVGQPRRIQFSLSEIFVLTAAIAAFTALTVADIQYWSVVAMYFVTPFGVGIGVGRLSRSRAELLTAPPIAAAFGPLPWAAFAPSAGNPLTDFLVWWMIMFPLVLLLGAIPALIGSALGYWWKWRNTCPGSNSAPSTFSDPTT